MLKQPRSKDIGCNFRKDPPFFLVLLSIGIVVFFSRAFATAYTGITSIACQQKPCGLDTINKRLEPGLYRDPEWTGRELHRS